jgi:hypothetical protein
MLDSAPVSMIVCIVTAQSVRAVASAVINASKEPEPYILLFVMFHSPSTMTQFLLAQEKDDEDGTGVGLGVDVGVGVGVGV